MATTNSPRWAILQAIISALQADPALAGITIIRNPRHASSLAKGERVIVVKRQPGSLIEKPGQQEKRRFAILTGAISRKVDADQDADALALAVGNCLRKALGLLIKQNKVLNLSESIDESEVEGLDIDGAIELSTWEIQYIQSRPL